MNATPPERLSSAPRLSHGHDLEDGRVFGSMAKGAALGTFVVFPALMGVLSLALSMEGAMILAVAVGTYMMSLLVGIQIGMGLWMHD